MAAVTDAPVLAGVGSERNLPLVRLAAREAAAYGRPLRLLHAFDWGAALRAPSVAGQHDAAEELLARATEVAKDVDETLPVSGEICEEPAVEALVRRSETSFLVAVGDSGMSTSPGACVPAEAPAVRIAARAGCPVLVGRRDPPPEGPVLVGVDGSIDSRKALAWAFEYAARREVRLVAVRVAEPGYADDEAVLTGIVARFGERHPAVPVECHTIRGYPGAVLVEQSRSAQLAVVAARGNQPGRGMLGSVSQSVLYHSPAPVIVVRGLAPTDGPDARDQGP